MIRDLIGLLLFAVCGMLGGMSYYLVKAGLVVEDRRLWPPWAMPIEIKLAGAFSSIGLLCGILGGLVFGGTSALPLWSIALVLWIVFWVGLLWGDFARPTAAKEEPLDARRPEAD